MTVWLVRAGRSGERETLALEQSLSVLGWQEMPDLSNVNSKEALEVLIRDTYPDAGKRRIANWTTQLWAFRSRIQVDDLVTLPLKQQSAVAIGKITGSYKYRPDLPADSRHTRSTKWLKTDVPRSKFGQDLLYTLGAFLTVCKVERNNAEERIKAIIAGQAPPAPVTSEGGVEDGGPIDLEQYAQDDISAFIGQVFKGHELTRLVDEILMAQGYNTLVSPEGADGGIDIVAGAGPMGFDAPRLGVQVKSGDSPIDVKVLRELQGALKNFGADQGLLVSWGGFTGPLLKEARRLHFAIRLWDAGQVVTGGRVGLDSMIRFLGDELLVMQPSVPSVA